MELYRRWAEFSDMEDSLKQQLLQMTEEEKQDAFYTELQFGTAGMRGVLGAGTNRMNIYMIRKANLGFGKWIQSYGEEACKRGVAIAYDNRHQSKEFAMESAYILASLGIVSFVFESLRPTPELSFTVRDLNCFGGIVITASHNPKEYNGYKVYDETGCQLIPELIANVIQYVNEIEDPLSIKISLSEEDKKKIHIIGDKEDKRYYEKVLGIQLRPEITKKDLKIVFSPQHGTALEAIKAVFDSAGYSYCLVEEQCSFDPDFSNTKTPNPEDERAYDLAIQYAKRENVDVVITTDPDADRVGIAVKHEGEYHLLSGNQTAAILLEYVFSSMMEKGKMPENPIMFNTVVTSDLGELIAKNYGVETEKTLTGFKFIGERIAAYEKSGEKSFVFGYEESYGYLIQDFVRDKDAIQASLMIAEACAYYKSKNKSLFTVLQDLYDIYGTFRESQVSKSFEGQVGAKRMQEIMEKFRHTTMKEIGGISVLAKEDYLTGVRYEAGIENRMPLLPFSDVLKFYLVDGSWLAIRPSGTEPKCKFYYCVKADTSEEAIAKEILLHSAIEEMIS